MKEDCLLSLELGIEIGIEIDRYIKHACMLVLVNTAGRTHEGLTSMCDLRFYGVYTSFLVT